MSIFAPHIRAAETGHTSTARVCMDLIHRHVERMERAQALADKQRAVEVKDRPEASSGGWTFGKGIERRSPKEGGPMVRPEAIEVIRRYVASGTMGRPEAARLAGVCEATVKKYAKLIAKGEL